MSKKVEIVKASKVGNHIEYHKTTIERYFGSNGAIETDGAVEGERALTHSFLMDTLRKIMGRTLTVIDASVHDRAQNKAMKDLLRQIFSDEMEFSAEWAFDQEILTKKAAVTQSHSSALHRHVTECFAQNEFFKGKTDEEIDAFSVSTEEVLGVQ